MNRVPCRSPFTPSRRRAAGGGFTLIELMVSLAIVVILILGVNTVFSIASRTIGAGQAMSTAQRGNLTGHSVFYEDLNQAVTFNAPFFMIRSESVAAFRNAAEEQTDRDYARGTTVLADVDQQIRTADWNGDGTEDNPGELTPRTTMDARMHRVDQLCFFARGLFPRQTGNDGTYIADMSASEAMIWYGHLAQPANPTDPSNTNNDLSDEFDRLRPPGFKPVSGGVPETGATNPNNFYASSWILGRMAVLLREPDANGDIRIRPNSPEAEVFISRPNNANFASLLPLEKGSLAFTSTEVPAPGSGKALFPIDFARYDLAGTSIDQFRNFLGKAIQFGGRVDNWYDPVKNLPAVGGLGYRFGTFQYPTRPLSSASAARTAPVFLPNCSQFAVEFAGDFITQDNNGDVVVGSGPDGIIDYVVVGSRGSGVNTVLLTKTRWYGYPRDTGSPGGGPPDGVVSGTVAGGFNPDVVPLRDIANNGTVGGAGGPFLFERDVDDGAIGVPQAGNYTSANGIPLNGRYLCAWGPDTAAANLPLPKMVRIIFALDDPQGRIAAAPTYEYVIQLP